MLFLVSLVFFLFFFMLLLLLNAQVFLSVCVCVELIIVGLAHTHRESGEKQVVVHLAPVALFIQLKFLLKK